MKTTTAMTRLRLAPLIVLAATCASPSLDQGTTAHEWRELSAAGVHLVYQAPNAQDAQPILGLATEARIAAQTFIGESIEGDYVVRIYPDRPGFEALWRQIGLQAQCWMIARANRIGVEILAPRIWASERCGHDGSDAVEVSRVLAHETVHVLHARVNASYQTQPPQDMSWFIEGLATYASGQLTPAMQQHAVAIVARGVDGLRLSALGTSADLYALGGSLVAYMDAAYGRAALRRAMRASSTAAMMADLHTSESAFLAAWVHAIIDR